MVKNPNLKSHFSKSIKFDYDIQEFLANIERIINNIQGNTKEILIQASTEFAKAAAKYTPPCIGKNSIEKRFYTRPILVLVKLVKGEYPDYTATQQDIEAMKKKMKYKVLNTKSGVKKGTAFGYCKTKSEAKKMAKIANRGLARVLWGKSLTDIDAKIPNNIVRLMAKAPDMTKKKLSVTTYSSQNEQETVTIQNKFSRLASFGKFAEKHGLKKVSNFINKKVKQLSEQNQEV